MLRNKMLIVHNQSFVSVNTTASLAVQVTANSRTLLGEPERLLLSKNILYLNRATSSSILSYIV
jgi:hypothetical protein